jgi:hypothetical protein
VSLDEFDRHERREFRKLADRRQMYAAFILDLETARSRSLISASCYGQAVDECRRQQGLLDDHMELSGSSFLRKVHVLIRLARQGVPAKTLRSLSFKLLPRGSYRALRLWRQRLRVRRTPS